MEKVVVGGQAVIEGVMMRSPHCLAVVVRAADGSLVVRQRRWISLWEKWKWLRRPFLRGVVVLAESLHNGVSTLNFSATVQETKGAEAKETPVSLWVTMGVAVVLALGLFAALPHFLTWGLGRVTGNDSLSSGTSLLFQVVDGVVKLGIFVAYLAAISLMKDVRRVFAYHGAEHKSIFAYEAGRPLTVAETAAFPTFHPRCGTSFLLVVLLIAILVFSVVFPFVPPASDVAALNQLFFVLVKLLLLFPIAGVSYEVIKLASRFPRSRLLRVLVWPGMAMQRITTRPPDEGQLEVALASIGCVLAEEERFRLHPERPVPERTERYASFAAFLKGNEGG